MSLSDSDFSAGSDTEDEIDADDSGNLIIYWCIFMYFMLEPLQSS